MGSSLVDSAMQAPLWGKLHSEGVTWWAPQNNNNNNNNNNKYLIF